MLNIPVETLRIPDNVVSPACRFTLARLMNCPPFCSVIRFVKMIGLCTMKEPFCETVTPALNRTCEVDVNEMVVTPELIRNIIEDVNDGKTVNSTEAPVTRIVAAEPVHVADCVNAPPLKLMTLPLEVVIRVLSAQEPPIVMVEAPLAVTRYDADCAKFRITLIHRLELTTKEAEAPMIVNTPCPVAVEMVQVDNALNVPECRHSFSSRIQLPFPLQVIVEIALTCVEMETGAAVMNNGPEILTNPLPFQKPPLKRNEFVSVIVPKLIIVTLGPCAQAASISKF